MKKRVFIVIPAYNEETVIGPVIHSLKKEGYNNIVVVDDGSIDATYTVSNQTGVIVLHHLLNRGKGAAIRTGVEAAHILDADVVVTFDGDGQHDPADISTLLHKINAGYDVVLGSRFLKKQQTIPRIKKIYNRIANIITYVLFGIAVTDSQSGIRAYGKKAFFALDACHDRYEFDTEVLREIRRLHLNATEVPVHVRYTAYSQNKYDKQTLISGIQTFVRMFLAA